ALALAFPLVHAQSASTGSVELYGVIDLGLERSDVGTESATRLQSGISAGSRWGIRGRENLGGGYAAIFTLEGRIEADTGSTSNNGALYYCRPAGSTATPSCPGVGSIGLTGATAAAVTGALNAISNDLLTQFANVNSVGALFDRQAYVGLITPFGAVLAGRQYTPGYEIMNKFNSFADATAGQFGQEFSTVTIRANNALQYRAEMSGFTLSLMYGFGGTEINRSERTSDPQTGDDFYGANLQYATNTFSVGIGYNHNYVLTRRDPTKADTGMETLNVGGTLTLGSAKLFAMYMSRKNDNPLVTPLDLQQIVIAGGTPAGINTLLTPLIARANRLDLDGPSGPRKTPRSTTSRSATSTTCPAARRSMACTGWRRTAASRAWRSAAQATQAAGRPASVKMPPRSSSACGTRSDRLSLRLRSHSRTGRCGAPFCFPGMTAFALWYACRLAFIAVAQIPQEVGLLHV
ncbi:MAG: porin, partial [Burkholderiaceae bacterium]|nr:porin [Burkholderiaceae bacterium]